MPRIIFTGGGSAGHVTPNIALIEKCQQNGWQVMYVGSYHGIEKTLISRLNIPYYPIATGKLRRYLSARTLLEPFFVLYGIFQAFQLCRRLKPDLVFSKGGFVGFPLVVAAFLNRIPVVAHESDLSPGLANRLSFPFVKLICVTFEEGTRYFRKNKKIVVTGIPLRSAFFEGCSQKGLEVCGFDSEKPVLFIYGGGLGSTKINQMVRAALSDLLAQFQIIHVCGRGKTMPEFQKPHYCQYEYVNEELPHLLACADIVISRAGANSIYELLTLSKPHILIPLSSQVSRGDQEQNAEYCRQRGLSLVISEEDLTVASLLATLKTLNEQKKDFVERMNALTLPNSVELIYHYISQQLR